LRVSHRSNTSRAVGTARCLIANFSVSGGERWENSKKVKNRQGKSLPKTTDESQGSPQEGGKGGKGRVERFREVFEKGKANMA